MIRDENIMQDLLIHDEELMANYSLYQRDLTCMKENDFQAFQATLLNVKQNNILNHMKMRLKH